MVVTMALCLSNLVACGEPLPAGIVPLSNADQAAREVLSFWGEGRGDLPMIYGVLADPACHSVDAGGRQREGFIDPATGKCVGGLYVEDFGALLLVHPLFGYSATLPHELQHWIRGDARHEAPGVWDEIVGGARENLVPRAQAHLRGMPEVDAIAVAGHEI